MEDNLMCVECKQTKSRDDFYQRKDRERGAHYECKECRSAYYKNKSLDIDWKNHRNKVCRKTMLEKRKALYAIVLVRKDNPCKDCGIKYPACVMDFDHIDSKCKTKNISQIQKFKNEDDLLNEIAKCELVCSNCHRLRTQARKMVTKEKE